MVTLLYEQGVDFVIILGCADVRPLRCEVGIADVRRLLVVLSRSGAPLHLLARLRLDESILLERSRLLATYCCDECDGW